MKILYYSSHPYLSSHDPSGYGTHMREMIKAFKELGHDVYPLIIGDGKTHVGQRGGMNSKKSSSTSWMPTYIKESVKDFLLLRKDRRYQNQLEEIIQQYAPDLIYERASGLQLSGVRAAQQFGIRHLLEINAPLAEEKKLFFGNSFFQRKVEENERIMLKATSKIICVSEALKNYFIEHYNLLSDKIISVPNAVNLEDFEVKREDVEQIKLSLKLENSKVVGFVGSIFPWHGVDLLIDAFQIIGTQHANSVLLIVGDGQIVPALKARAEKSAVSNRIIFTGNIAHREVKNYMALMDIAVMAKSNWYGSPVKIFEYGVMGKAIVGPDVGPVSEVMKDGVDGILVKPDVNSLHVAIQKLLDSESLRKDLSTSFKQKVISNHTWIENARRTLQ